MTIGAFMIVGGLVYAYWNATNFEIYGMGFGYVIALSGVVVFVENFARWWAT